MARALLPLLALPLLLVLSSALSAGLSRNLRGLSAAPAELRVGDVAVGVLTCAKYADSRLIAQLETWLAHVPNRLFFSDAMPAVAGSSAVRREDVFLERHPPNPSELLGNKSGAWRALSMVEILRERFPSAKWYFFVDDDTYVYVSNLLAQVLGPRNPKEQHYVGWAFTPGPGLRGFLPGQWRPRTAIGGAGFAVSSALMARLAPAVPRCRRAYAWDWPGDVRIASCIADLGLGVEDDLHLHADGPDELSPPGARPAIEIVPASFHHLAPVDVRRLYAGQLAWRPSDGFRADFAALALAEVTLRDPTLNLVFHVRFGYDVHVFNITAKGQNDTEVLRTDRITAFAPAANSAHDFEQILQGGRCPAHPARPAEVGLELVCGGCSRGDPSGAGADAAVRLLALGVKPRLEACRAKATGPCGWRLVLAAASCPKFEV